MATTTSTTTTDVNAHDEHGRTKIYLAAEAGNVAEVARLLELKADFDLSYHYSKFVLCKIRVDLTFNKYRTLRRRTPLQIACEKGHALVVRLLLKAG